MRKGRDEAWTAGEEACGGGIERGLEGSKGGKLQWMYS